MGAPWEVSPRPAGPQAGGSGRGPGEVLGGFWQAVGLLGSSRTRVLGELYRVLERFRRGLGRSMGGEATAGRARGRALETHYIEMSLSFCFELEIRQNVS